ncbi:MAG: hypothetical protein V4710_15725, partial [Verrucomicrobiota bacterium]
MKTRSSGSAVLAVLLTVALVTGLLTVVYSLTSNSAISTRRTVNRTVAAAYADAVMESYFDQWRTLMLNSAIPQDRADGVQNSGLTGITVPDSTVIERPSGVQAPVNSGVKAATPMLQPLPLATDRPVPENGTTVASRKRLNYLATVTVPYNVSRGTGSVTLQRIFVRGGRTLFDYFFFGTQPRVEFHPGAPMYVNGDVYVQGELYVAHDDLHFLNDVTFTEKLTIGYSPDDPRTPNTTIDDDAEGVSDNWVIAPHIGSEQKLFDTPQSALDPTFTDSNMANNTDSDGNLNNDGYHEMIEKPAATGNDPLSISDVENHRLSYNADYRVEIDAANNVTIYKRASSATTGAPTETVLSTTNAEYVALKGALTTDNAIFDTREGDYVRVITMDVNKIRIAGEPASVGATPILKDELNVTPNTKDGLAIHLQDNSQGTSLSTYLSTPGTPYIAAIPPVPAVAYQAPVPYKPATYYPNGTIKTKAVPAVPEILAQPAIPGVPAVPA